MGKWSEKITIYVGKNRVSKMKFPEVSKKIALENVLENKVIQRGRVNKKPVGETKGN